MSDDRHMHNLSAMAGIIEGLPMAATVIVEYLDEDGQQCIGYGLFGDGTLSSRIGAMRMVEHWMMTPDDEDDE